MSQPPLRILVYGVTGSGKTTFARAVAQRLDLNLILADDLAWGPDWQQHPPEVQLERIDAATAGDNWVLDSAYGFWLPVVRPRVDLVLGLDYPRWLSLSRLLRRTAHRCLTGEPCCNGNRETWRQAFSRDSIIGWHFKSFANKRDRMRQWEAEGQKVVRFRHPREAAAWLNNLNRESALNFGPHQTV